MVSPLISFISTRGLVTDSSKPSRLIISIKIERCSIPRPATWNSSVLSGSLVTRMATFFSSSFINRSRSWRLVTKVPSRPANGESLMRNTMLKVGSSTAMGSSADGLSGQAMVSPISMSAIPTTAQTSPEYASSASTRPKRSKVKRPLTGRLALPPDRLMWAIRWFLRMLPAVIRPTANLPKNSL